MSFFSRIKSLMRFSMLPVSEKQVVFYSEGKAYWPHLEGLLKEFLDVTEASVCYVSSSPNDPGLRYNHPQLEHFLLDEGFVRDWFFANLQCAVLVMTMPDLDQYQVKKSKHPVHYVYVQHSMLSCHMVYRPGAFDHFDTIFCGGPHHKAEIRALEQLGNLRTKTLIEHGYARLDSLLETSQKMTREKNKVPHILIAPSWGPHALIESVGPQVVDHLLAAGFKVTLRPHPQTMKFSTAHVRAIHAAHKSNDRFTLEADVSGQSSLHASDLMISDWSGAAIDYALGLEKPVVFIDVPRKVNNPAYTNVKITPFEVTMREKLGTVLSPDDLSDLPRVAKALLFEGPRQVDFKKLRKDHLYNERKSAKVGAEALEKLCANMRAQAA